MPPSTKRARFPRGRLRIAAVALVAVTPVTACGNGGGGQGSSAGSDEAKRTSVTVLRSTGATFEVLYIAQEQGFFKDAGLDVTIKPGAQDTSQNAPSVIKGEAQFAMTDGGGFVKAAAQDLPVRIVSGIQSSTTKTPPSDGLLVKPDSDITSFKDLEGKTVGLPALGGTIQFICEYSTQQAGGDPSKIKFVALPPPALVDAVSSGKVDAAYTFATFYFGGQKEGLRVLGKGTNELPGLVQSLLFSSRSYLAKNGSTAKKFIDALAKGVDYANSHPEDVRAVDLKYTKLPPDFVKTRDIQQYNTKINTKVMKTFYTSMVEFGMISSTPDENNLYWDKAPTTTTSE